VRTSVLWYIWQAELTGEKIPQCDGTLTCSLVDRQEL